MKRRRRKETDDKRRVALVKMTWREQKALGKNKKRIVLE